mmetsp:Transcript_9107/g.16343  ORF Transcript_9107/g.16343 Transcript_9107/m.16343 type:complete len:804 (+) Transcript_9107:69-2480(+)
MSAFTSLKSAIFPWRRGSAASESKVDVKESPVDGPKCALKVEHLEPAKAADKSRFPWRRQVSTGTDLDDSTPLKGPSARQESAALTESTCATLTPECSDTSSALSEPEDSTDEKLSDCSPKEPELSVVNEHGLKVSSNSWAAALQARRKKAEQGEALSHEEVVRKMKAILNKLTIEKFSSLSNQLISCGIRSTSLLEALTNEICEKATTQHHFVHMYADLCVALHDHFARQDQQKMNFKKILLSTCQASFEKHLTPPASLKTLKGEELKEAEQFYKLQMLGNIKFVGALIVRKMLAVRVMFAIIEELLSDPTSEALESLVALLTVVGPTFDQPEFPQQFLLAAIFQQVEGRTKDSCIKYRVRCLLKDLLELRASRWQDRKPKKLEGPTTLKEVAQKFHAEVEASSPSKTRSKHFSRQFSTPSEFTRQVSWQSCAFTRQVSTQSCCDFTRQDSTQSCGFSRQVSMESNCEFLRQDSCEFSRQVSIGKPAFSRQVSLEFSRQVSAGKPATALAPTSDQHASSPAATKTLSDQTSPPSLPVKPVSPPAQPSTNSEADQGSPISYEELSAEELVDKVTLFIEANSLDEEAAEDLMACPPEVQRAVLSRGDVTSGRNPSAMLRVRINQSLRKLKINPKVVERARATRAASKSAQSPKASEQPKSEKKEAAEQRVDKDLCHKKLSEIYAELMVSHDIQDAVASVSETAVPSSLQSQEFCDLLVFILERSSDALRSIGFKFVVAIFAKRCWVPAALQEGLRSFAGMCDDLKLDLPALPKILNDELVTSFEPLVSTGLLSGAQLRALSAAV